MADPVVREGLGFSRQATLESTQDWISKAWCAFAILLSGEHVGNVVLDQHDAWLGTARFSLYLGAARGQGVGKTASRLALRHGFGERDLHKIWLTVHCENLPAIKLYRSLGFVQEGILRDEFRIGDRRLDALRMGLLKGELVGD